MEKTGDFQICTLKIPARIKPYIFPVIAIFALLLAAYGNSFKGEWVFDDEPNILINTNVHLEHLDFSSLKKALYDFNGKLDRPLAFLTFGLNYYFGRTNVFGYHLVNFIIHYLSAVFLFLFIFKTLHLPMLRERYAGHAYTIALMAAVFWAINPIQVTAVTYIVQRMASMSGLFYIMSMYFYLLARTSQRPRRQIGFFAGALLCALLSFASKQNAAMLPVSLFLYDLFLIQGVNKATLIKNLPLAAGTLAILLVLGFMFTDLTSILRGYDGRPFTLAERLLTQPRIIFLYISQLLYPLDSRLTLIHDVQVSSSLFSPITTILSISGIAGSILFALIRSPQNGLLSFSILFFFVNHAIEGSFIPLELIYEHRNYIPSFFFFVPIAVFIVRALRYFSYRKILQACIILLISVIWIVHGHTVYTRNNLFTDPLVLWIDNGLKAPGLSRVQTNLGTVSMNRGMHLMAYEAYKKANDLRTHHNVHNLGIAHYNLGIHYLHVSRNNDQALFHFDRARQIYPAFWKPWYYLGVSLLINDQKTEAEALALESLTRWPRQQEFHYLLGLIHLKQNDYERARAVATRALRQGLPSVAFFRLLGATYFYDGAYDRAALCWNQVLRADKTDVDALLALVETNHRMDNYGTRDRLMIQVMYLKGSRTWNAYLEERALENGLNAYIIRPSILLPIIRESLESMLPDG